MNSTSLKKKKIRPVGYWKRYNSTPKRKLEIQKHYYANKIRYVAKRREERSQNKEEWRQHWRDYRANNKEKFKLYEKKRQEKKTEQRRIRFLNPDVRKRHRIWSKKNRELKPELHISKIHRRRALRLKATINLKGIKEFVKSVKGKKAFICYYCQKTFPVSVCHFDHIVPLCKGGAHSVENLCASCQHCNSTKYTRSFGVWIKTGQQILNL